MVYTVAVINLFALACLLWSLLKDPARTRRSLAISLRSFLRVLPSVLAIVVLIGLLRGFLPPELVSRILGERSGFWGVMVAASLGTVLHIPSIISFPLAASVLEEGASVTAVAAFVTTLTMIGTVTLPIEARELGRRFALLRNGLSFVLAIIVALIMGAIL